MLTENRRPGLTRVAKPATRSSTLLGEGPWAGELQLSGSALLP